MRRLRSAEELAEHWSLEAGDEALVMDLPDAGKLGLIAQLTFWRRHGTFPEEEADLAPDRLRTQPRRRSTRWQPGSPRGSMTRSGAADRSRRSGAIRRLQQILRLDLGETQVGARGARAERRRRPRLQDMAEKREERPTRAPEPPKARGRATETRAR